MIFTVGDSHSKATFEGIPNVSALWLGPITMSRAGHPDDALLSSQKFSGSKPGDHVVLCFGEIDCRCYVKPRLEVRTRTIESIVSKYVGPYIEKVDHVRSLHPDLDFNVMSVVPAFNLEVLDERTRKAFTTQNNFPVVGSDDERSQYVREMNRILKESAGNHGLGYFDVHTLYADDRGLLPPELGHGVHIGNTQRVREYIASLGW